MPNFAYTNTTQFRPFSFEEQLRPLLMYTQAHQAVEEAYSELDSKANAIGSLANEANDPVTYQRYKAYESALRTQADALAKNGLTPGSRQSLLDLKGRYAKDITPIQNAITRRRELADEQRKALLQDPTLMFQRDMNSMSYESSLDRFLENPDYNYGERYSGKLITAQAASAASTLAKEMQEKPRKWRSILGDSYYETMMQKGFSSQAVLQAIQDNPDAAPQLTRIVEDAVNSSGVRNWGDKATIARAIDYAKQGLWSAVGETQYQTLQNPGYLNPLQRAQLEKLKRELNTTPTGGLALNPSNIYSSRELSKDEKKYKDNIENFSQYFYKDSHGQMRMNQAGWKEYNRKNYGEVAGKVITTPEGTTIRVASSNGKESASEFRKFMDSIGAAKVTNGNWQPGNFGNVWSKYVHASPVAKTAKYDATKTTEYIYDVPVSDEYQNNFKSKLSRAIGSDEKLVEVDYDAKSNRWVPTGETLAFSKFDTKDYKLVSRAPSEVGTTWFIKKGGEKAKRYLAPPGINITAEDGRDQAISEMLITQRMLQNPNLTPQQRAKLENHYDNLTQQQIMFESQLDLTNQTSTQNINPYYVP